MSAVSLPVAVPVPHPRPATPFAAEGTHWLVDCHGVAPETLRDADALARLLHEAADAAGARILFSHFHRFGGDGDRTVACQSGVTGVVLLAESHVTIHTWPEHRFAAVDLFLCGRSDATAAIDRIARGLAAERIVTRAERRGGPLPVSAIDR